jgi:hypothetical protein
MLITGPRARPEDSQARSRIRNTVGSSAIVWLVCSNPPTCFSFENGWIFSLFKKRVILLSTVLEKLLWLVSQNLLPVPKKCHIGLYSANVLLTCN